MCSRLTWHDVNRALSVGDAQKNIETAMNAAEKFFRVEKFLTAREVGLLDDKGMLVFLSECETSIPSPLTTQHVRTRVYTLHEPDT